MKVLITGGAGFIGSHLSDYLIKKKNISKVIVIDNIKDGSVQNLKNSFKSNKFKFYKADINNFREIVKKFKSIDLVYHLAALSDVVPSIDKPIDYMHSNIIGTVNVLEAMRKANVKKIIYAASSSCYGITKNVPTKETHQINTIYPYSLSKNIGEQIIIHWSKTYNISFVSLRLFNVYGTRSRTNSAYGAALGVFIKQKLSNYPFTIIGSGKQKRDFIHVNDVVRAFFLASKKFVKNQIINIGSGKPRSVLEMVKILEGKKTFIPKRPGEPDITHANIEKAKKFLKWQPKISLEIGLNEILKNSSYWKKSPLWTKLKIRKATKNWFRYLN